MIALYIIGGIIALILIIAAFTGTAWTFEKSIQINAPVDRVWQHTKSFATMNQWSPYIGRDPQIKQTITGIDGTPGATYSWDSAQNNVGAGNQTITEINEGKRLSSRINFIRPFKGVADAEIRIAGENGGTRATWYIASSTPYPMNIIKLFGVIEKNMDRDFNLGLGKLKALCEA